MLMGWGVRGLGEEERENKLRIIFDTALLPELVMASKRVMAKRLLYKITQGACYTWLPVLF